MSEHDDDVRFEVGTSDGTDYTPRDPAAKPRSLAVAAAVALAGALVGAVVWGLIVKSSDYEVGIVAWGIGFIVGTAVVLVMGGRRDLPLQVIAVSASLIGILLGKYLSYAFVVQEDAKELFGVDFSLFSGDMIDFFFENLGNVFSFFDVVWIGLAVFTAWKITRPDEPKSEPAA